MHCDILSGQLSISHFAAGSQPLQLTWPNSNFARHVISDVNINLEQQQGSSPVFPKLRPSGLRNPLNNFSYSQETLSTVGKLNQNKEAVGSARTVLYYCQLTDQYSTKISRDIWNFWRCIKIFVYFVISTEVRTYSQMLSGQGVDLTSLLRRSEGVWWLCSVTFIDFSW